MYGYYVYMYLRAWVNQTVHLEREDLCKQKSQNVYIYIIIIIYVLRTCPRKVMKLYANHALLPWKYMHDCKIDS